MMKELDSVFWAVLFSTFLSGAKGRGWKYLAYLEFDTGDLIQTESGMYLVAESTIKFFYLESVDSYHVTVKKGDKIYEPWSDLRAKKVLKPLPFAETLGWQLANRLLEKKLPFSSNGCNILHYVDYILFGNTRATMFQSRGVIHQSCPLARDLHVGGITSNDIKHDNFYLKDLTNYKYFVNNIRRFNSVGAPWYSESFYGPSVMDTAIQRLSPSARLIPPATNNSPRRGGSSYASSSRSAPASSSGIFSRGFFGFFRRSRGRRN